jgi:hypothetical protein
VDARLPASLALVALLASGSARAGDDGEGGGNSTFLFVPYPITEPTIGSGVLAGPVWMRAGPEEATGPSRPQAFGAGALWTDGGSRGVVAFDHRAWRGGRWRTTAIGGRVDLRLVYDGLAPGGDADRGFSLVLRGASVAGERRLGDGPATLGVRLFATHARVDFSGATPSELLDQATAQDLDGFSVSWGRDTRDDVYSPARGQAFDAGATVYAPALGASFAAHSVSLKWRGYRPFGRSVLGARVVVEASGGDLPFYLRPYVGFRGVPALRYAGARVASLEGEWRRPLGAKWDVLAFGGIGTARADARGGHAGASVSAGGLGVRRKMPRYFGLTVGIDVAKGPDGTVGYVQVGNAWSR